MDPTSTFENKKKLLFDSLQDAEKIIKKTSLEQITSADYHQHKQKRPTIAKKINILKFRGKESIFKRPEASISKCLKPKRIPDYEINKSKWTKYSLDDVDISDKTNTAAAFQFLNSIEKRNKSPNESEEEDCNEMFNARRNNKRNIIFHKSISLKCKNPELSNAGTEEKEKSVLVGSKVVMPEFNFNQKIRKETKRKVIQNKTKELKLDHLLNEDDEEGEEMTN